MTSPPASPALGATWWRAFKEYWKHHASQSLLPAGITAALVLWVQGANQGLFAALGLAAGAIAPAVAATWETGKEIRVHRSRLREWNSPAAEAARHREAAQARQEEATQKGIAKREAIERARAEIAELEETIAELDSAITTVSEWPQTLRQRLTTTEIGTLQRPDHPNLVPQLPETLDARILSLGDMPPDPIPNEPSATEFPVRVWGMHEMLWSDAHQQIVEEAKQAQRSFQLNLYRSNWHWARAAKAALEARKSELLQRIEELRARLCA